MKIILIIFAILFSACSLERKPQIIIPDENIDRIFTKILDNPMSQKYGLTKLRETSLSSEDLEIRIWVSIGSEGLDGFIVKRNKGNWSAIAIKEVDCNRINYYKGKFYKIGKLEISPPKSGWENAWQKLVETDVLDLPTYSEPSLIDGFSYTVELNTNNTYRIYRYASPDVYKNKEPGTQKRKNIQQMLKIGEIIADEFGLGNFKEGNMCL